jgi:phosphoribosyl 1,2-cyclic phosphodiesterase
MNKEKKSPHARPPIQECNPSSQSSLPRRLALPTIPIVLRFAVLGSGSAGNSAVVESEGVRLLIDAGLSGKQLVSRIHSLGLSLESFDGILLTHEHGDHIRGLRMLLKQMPVPVYATAATARVVQDTGIQGATWKVFDAGQPFRIGCVQVEAFAIQHDAVDPVGFVFQGPTAKFGFLSDAGFVTRGMIDRLRGVHALFVEANYDENLLEADTKRPWSIKQRITSRHGHLSNDQMAELAAELAHPGLRRIVLGHLSLDCNAPDLAISILRESLEKKGHPHIELHCACAEVSPWWELATAPVFRPREQQLLDIF